MLDLNQESFEWDPDREAVNIAKHKVDFITAAYVFKDPERKIRIFGAGYWRKGKIYYEKKD